MHISVIGAGAVGGALAAMLARAGHEVSVVARSATARTIASHGIELSGAAGKFRAPVAVAASVTPEAEAVLLAVKSFQAFAALQEQLPAIGARDVIVLQNGVRGPELASTLLRRRRGVFGLITTFPATGLGPGRTHLTGLGTMQLAPFTIEDAPRTRQLAAVFRDALPTAAARNLPGLLWTKLLLNQVNALPAITGTSVQYAAAHPLLSEILAVSLHETVTVIDRLRVRPEPIGGLHPSHLSAIRQGLALRVVRARLGRMFGPYPNPASTLQSIRRGEATEIDALNGEVVRTANELGVSTPGNALLTTLVHEVAATGRFLPASEVHRRWQAL